MQLLLVLVVRFLLDGHFLLGDAQFAVQVADEVRYAAFARFLLFTLLHLETRRSLVHLHIVETELTLLIDTEPLIVKLR